VSLLSVAEFAFMSVQSLNFKLCWVPVQIVRLISSWQKTPALGFRVMLSLRTVTVQQVHFSYIHQKSGTVISTWACCLSSRYFVPARQSCNTCKQLYLASPLLLSVFRTVEFMSSICTKNVFDNSQDLLLAVNLLHRPQLQPWPGLLTISLC